MVSVLLWVVCFAPAPGVPACSRPFSLYNALSFSDRMRDEFPSARIWVQPQSKIATGDPFRIGGREESNPDPQKTDVKKHG